VPYSAAAARRPASSTMNHTPLTDLVPGVVAGLAAAFFSALSYLVSRHHGLVQRALGRRAVPLRLLALAHVIMAAVCLPACVALWPAASPAVAAFALPLTASAGFYLLGQAALFAALGRVEASRIAPLLGLKIVMLAVIVSFVLGERLDARQWLAVAMSVGAALMLQAGHGAVPRGALGFVLGCSLCFAVSDLWIVKLITGLETGVSQAGGSLGRLHAGVLAMVLTYGGCGLLFAPLLGRLAPLTRADWVASAQYAGAWLGSMTGLYCCFGLVGVVFGNILQATRGPMSVALGALLAHLGWHELEQRVDRGTFLRRFAAAALMTVAIAVYVIDLW
jgi:drug/metabolite transporter (DMT)-like permease